MAKDENASLTVTTDAIFTVATIAALERMVLRSALLFYRKLRWRI